MFASGFAAAASPWAGRTRTAAKREQSSSATPARQCTDRHISSGSRAARVRTWTTSALSPPDAAGSLAFPGRTRLEPPASFLAARRRCCQGHPQHSPGRARRSHRGRRCCSVTRVGQDDTRRHTFLQRRAICASAISGLVANATSAAPSPPHGVRDRSPTPPAGTAAKRSAAKPRRSPPRARPRPGNCPASRAHRSIAGRPRPNAVLSSETRCRRGSRRSPGFWPSSPAAPPRGRPAAEPVSSQGDCPTKSSSN